jgi:hypothetical protein
MVDSLVQGSGAGRVFTTDLQENELQMQGRLAIVQRTCDGEKTADLSTTLRSPAFPVELGGVGAPHASHDATTRAGLKKSRIH